MNLIKQIRGNNVWLLFNVVKIILLDSFEQGETKVDFKHSIISYLFEDIHTSPW